jgi:hypothetical protein
MHTPTVHSNGTFGTNTLDQESKLQAFKKLSKKQMLESTFRRNNIFVTQLKSGDVIVEKALTAENVANVGMEQAKRQMQKE